MGRRKRSSVYATKTELLMESEYTDAKESTATYTEDEEIVRDVLQMMIDNVVITSGNERVQSLRVRNQRPRSKAPKSITKKSKYNCCVQGCPNSKTTEKVKFHHLPKENSGDIEFVNQFGRLVQMDRLLAWEKALSLTKSNTCNRVCYKHFLDSDYIYYENCKTPALKKNAVPFLFLLSDLNITKKRTKMQKPIEKIKVEPMEQIVVKQEVTVQSDPLKIDSRCAVCLGEPAFHNIYEIQDNMTILKMLELCTGYEIEMPEQTLVPGICEVCYKELLAGNSYRKKYIKSQTTLESERSEPFVTNKPTVSAKKDQPVKIRPELIGEINAFFLLAAEDNERSACTPLKCFEHFMGVIMEKMTDYTNEAIQEQAKSAADFPEETCKDELLAFVGLFVFAGSAKRINMDEEELYNITFAGTMYELIINSERFKFLLEHIMFYGTKNHRNILEFDGFTHFMHGVWNLFMDRCIETALPTVNWSSVTWIEHYLLCNTHCPVQRFKTESTSWRYGIKMVTHFDSNNNVLLKSYPCTGNDSSQVVDECCDPETRNSFRQLWSQFYCSQNSQRWPMILFYAMVTIASINSYSMYCGKVGKLPEDVFLRRLSNALLLPLAKKKLCLGERKAHPILLQLLA